MSFDELKDAYAEAAAALVEGGVDLLLVETVFDTLNAKAALFAIDEYFETNGIRLPLIVSGTITDGPSEGMFKGPAAQWVENLAETAVSYGFDTFIFWGEGSDQLDRFAQEVVPAARQQLAQQ